MPRPAEPLTRRPYRDRAEPAPSGPERPAQAPLSLVSQSAYRALVGREPRLEGAVLPDQSGVQAPEVLEQRSVRRLVLPGEIDDTAQPVAAPQLPDQLVG